MNMYKKQYGTIANEGESERLVLLIFPEYCPNSTEVLSDLRRAGFGFVLVGNVVHLWGAVFSDGASS